MSFKSTWMLLVLGVGACVSHSAPAPAQGLDPLLMQESYIGPAFRKDNLDSIAVWQSEKEPWAIVTAKASDQLHVYNAQTGALIRKVGQPGSGQGEFRRPNGILVWQDWLLVVERDNHRVHLMELPTFKTLALIGQDDLKKPYGLTAFETSQGLAVLVTDDYPVPGKTGQATFSERIKRFVIRRDNPESWKYEGAFGPETGQGRLFKVESILADKQRNRVFICDEKGDSKGIKIFDMQGNFQKMLEVPGAFIGEPEGLAFWQFAGNTYLVATDQQPKVSVFHVLDLDLNYKGCFRGAKTANTDGIAIVSTELRGLPNGGIWAIHDDRALTMFDPQQLHSQLDL